MNKIAILYQANPAPVIDGIQKPMKLGGYSDSGADIALALQQKEFPVLTPISSPNEKQDFDWVFPDTKVGIQKALENGASIFWLNTVVFKGHPIEDFFNLNIEIVGQLPKKVSIYDDKFFTNNLLKSQGLPIPPSFLIKKENSINDIKALPFDFPVVLKPVRGRGSQGVSVVTNESALKVKVKALFDSHLYGTVVYAEAFLPKEEITVTVMPPGKYRFGAVYKEFSHHWSLPPVKRFNHQEGILPYSGKVAVVYNSVVLEDEVLATPTIQLICRQCEKAATIIEAKAPIRIDCRADESGDFFLFDLNLKPNMTGPSRAHRKDQDSLTTLAAKKIGWSYGDFVENILYQRWSWLRR